MAGSPRKKVMKTVLELVHSGRYAPGMRLPTEFELVELLSVSRGTVRSGLKELMESGVVEQRPKSGWFVCRGAVPAPERPPVAFIAPGLLDNPTGDGAMLSGIQEEAFRLGASTQFFNLNQDPDKAGPVVKKLSKQAVTGIVYRPLTLPDYYRINSRILDLFETAGLPYVVIDTPIVRCGVIRGNFVGGDGYTGMRRLVHRLAQRGYRRFGSIRVFPGIYTGDQRFGGIQDELAALELPMREDWHRVIADTPATEQGRPEIRALWRNPGGARPEVVLCTHDLLAANAIDELGRLGLRCPEDAVVTGFDDLPHVRMLGFPTVSQPFLDMGRRAAEVLTIDTRRETVRQEFLPCGVKLRGLEAGDVPARDEAEDESVRFEGTLA